jgi:hypothetical protein
MNESDKLLNETAEDIAPDEVLSLAPAKPAAKRGALIIVAVATVVVVAAAIVAFVLLAAPRGYEAAEKNFLSGLASAVPDIDAPQNYIFSAEYDGVGADLKEIFNIEPPKEVISLVSTLTLDGENSFTSLKMALGEKALSMFFGEENGEMYIAAPEASKNWLFINVNELLAELGIESDGDIPALQQDFEQMYASLNDSLTKVVDGYFELVKPVTTESKDVITGGKVSIDATKYSVPFSQKVLTQIVLLAVDELQTNEDLIAYIAAATQNDVADINKLIADFEAEGTEALVEATDETYLTMNVWVKDNQIIARELYPQGNPTASISYKILDDGKNIYAGVTIAGETYDVELTNDGGYSGQFQIENLTVTLDKLNFSKDLKYITSGKLIFNVVELPMSVDIITEFSVKDDQQMAVISGVLTDLENNGTKYSMGALTLTAGLVDSVGVKPGLDEQYGIDIFDIMNQDEQAAMDLLTMLTDVMTKIGDVYGPEASDWFTNMIGYVIGEAY